MSNYGSSGGPHPGPPPEPWSHQPDREPYRPAADPWGEDTGGEPGRGAPWSRSDGSPARYWDRPTRADPWDRASGDDPWGARHDGWNPPAQGRRPRTDLPSDSPGTFQPGEAHPRYHLPHQQRAHSDQTAPMPGPVPTRRGRRTPLVVLSTVAVLACGGGATAVYMSGKDDPAPVSQPTAGPDDATGSPVPSAEPEPQLGTPTPESSVDARFVKAGQCVRNEGDSVRPKLAIAECGPKTYEVLKRFDGMTTGKEDARTKCAKVEGYTDWYFFDSPLDVLDYVLCLKAR